jgi:hypothetical protein
MGKYGSSTGNFQTFETCVSIITECLRIEGEREGWSDGKETPLLGLNA